MKHSYSFGTPSGSYDDLLDLMSKTSIYSGQTSSIPLAEFWHPKRNANYQKQLLQAIGVNDQDYKLFDKCFEYPTKACHPDGRVIQYSGASMSDLVFLSKDCQVTIEAKYTEYYKDPYPYAPLIGEWKAQHSSNNNRIHILNAWRRYIGLSEYVELTDSVRDDDFPYQFLHRAASACANTNVRTRVLLYQLFYDETTVMKLNAFENDLRTWAKQLGLDSKNLKFVIAEIQIDVVKSPAIHSRSKGDIFLSMKQTPQYTFKSLTCRNGYTLETIQ